MHQGRLPSISNSVTVLNFLKPGCVFTQTAQHSENHLDYESSSHTQGLAQCLAYSGPSVNEETNSVNKIGQKNCFVTPSGLHPPSLFLQHLYINL